MPQDSGARLGVYWGPLHLKAHGKVNISEIGKRNCLDLQEDEADFPPLQRLSVYVYKVSISHYVYINIPKSQI